MDAHRPLAACLLLAITACGTDGPVDDDPRDRVHGPAPTLRADGPQEVRITDGGLTVNGTPFFVRGAGYLEQMPSVAALGGNSVRTWGEGNARAVLDEARPLGLLVTLGLWVNQPAQGFDYGVPAAVAAHIAQHQAAIDRYRDDPALLLWGIGNEVNMPHADGRPADPRAWDAIEAIAAHAHAVDPDHPTMSVVTDITPELIALVKERAPSIDVLGINSYEGLPTLPDRLRAAGWTKPYIVTEWNGPGAWASPTTPWGVVLETASGPKAARFAALHDTFAADPRCAGGYVFAWGSIVTRTPTWFSLFDPAGRRTELVDAVARVWTGAWPANRAPSVAGLTIDGQAQATPVGASFTAHVDATDAEADALAYTWELRADLRPPSPTGIDAMPPLLATTTSAEATVTLAVPGRDGAYRLYVTVSDPHGGVGVASAPLLVEAAINPPPSIGPDARLHVGDFHESPVTDAAALSAGVTTSVWDGGSVLTLIRDQPAEGSSAHRATAGGSGWLGLGVATSSPIDVSAWTTLHVSLRSRVAALEPVLSIAVADAVQVAAAQGSTVLARDHGFRSDGAWHHLAIPLADFQAQAAVDLTALVLGFGLSAAPTAAGDWVEIDGLYLSADVSGT